MTVRPFYDELAPRHHLVYVDWDASIARQGAALDSVLREYFPAIHDLLDVAVGIGTQAIGLARLGYRVTGSDLSLGAVHRAAAEAAQRGLDLPLHVADFQKLPVATATTGLILCCDNSLPHLQSPAAILGALREWYRCLRPGGGCLVSMRDYDEPQPPGTVEERPYGERTWNGRRYMLQQRWTWNGPRYDVTLDMTGLEPSTPSLRPITTSYLAIPVAEVAQLMTEAGFGNVVALADRLFQPVLVGFKPHVP